MKTGRAIQLVERPDGAVDLVVAAQGVSLILELSAVEAIDLSARLSDGAAPARVWGEGL